MYSPLRHIKRKKEEKFTGYLNFVSCRVFFDKGMLCSAEHNDDRFWILRRLLCSNHITDEYAQELEETEEELQLYLFPTLPETEWIRFWKDRSRQNVFDVLAEITPSEEISCFVDKLPFLHETNLEDLVRLRQQLYPLQSRLPHIWIKAKNSNPHVKANASPLPAIIAQSPWEEVDTLLSIHEMIEEGEIDWGENVAALEGEILEGEESLFVQEDTINTKAQFVVSHQFLDRVQLQSNEDNIEDL